MIHKIENISIRGISNCVPKNSISNLDYKLTSETERKMLIKTTGIENRRVAEEGICASDLCFEAAKELISKLKWEKDTVDALIFVSQSQDYYLPATSIILQDKLGLSKTTIALDINLGCSGYVYGLYIISTMLAAGGIKRALLLCGDVSTNSVNYEDKSSYPLFGDSGSATALEFDLEAGTTWYNLGSDGAGHQSIMIKGGGTKHKFHKDSLKVKEVSPGIKRHELNIILDGLEIFNFSVKEVPKNIREILEFSNVSIENIDQFIFHQANKIINETIRKKLKIAPEKVPYSLPNYGNTSSGSIPLTMQTKIKEELTTGKNKLLLSGFGVGLSWGSVILDTSYIVIPELIEI
jgi:3-oxoacyl-[acyl-carrier-protein] synthase-3